MYGKFFASAFTGSMVGSGLNVFALWGYIIANAKKDGLVELNPPIIAATLGCSVGEVQAAIETLSSPDPNSRSKKEEGRRIIQRAAFLYFIPTHADYQAIRDDAGRQEYMRDYMREYRAKGVPVKVNVNDSKPPLAHIDVALDLDVNVDKPKAKSKAIAPAGAVYDFFQGLPDDLARDWKAVRKTKKAANTATARRAIEREAAKAGLTFQQAATTACENGWSGFKADWLSNAVAVTAKPRANDNFAGKVYTGTAQEDLPDGFR